MTSKDSRGPSALQQILELCRTYGFSVPSDVSSVQAVIEDALAAFNFAGGDEASPADLRKSHAAEKSGPEKSLAASEEKFANAERRIQEFEDIKDTLDDSSTKVDEAKAKSKTSEEHVRFLEDNLSKQRIQLIEKEASSRGDWKRVVVLERSLANASAEVKRPTTQHTVGKDLLDGVRTVLALDNTA